MYYKVNLYPGCGVELKTGYYEADSPEASIQLPCYWRNYKDLKEDEILEFEDSPEFVYLDRSEYGEENGYLYFVNAQVKLLTICSGISVRLLKAAS